ncbi:phosphatidylglycerophosphate synthase [Desulfomicrobium macestii]|uniref:Phosphatidylglycerophosphate synthase n=1 Tax=Desulfomicrobium macestii TaxID=90731 RepID=A0ABR9H1W3_9BACT|nr:CDP-alcohol phosphatidyltransferase family protein [Desulfomicrobium macestii]MBE1424692.1 phosphatidylglycerophosphate synthase [Desulfomicrobium macestii]
MLDTHARRLFQPLFDTMAYALGRRGIGPAAVTLSAALLGGLAAGALALGWPVLFLALLWLSGLLDAVDGTLARQGGLTSRAGAMLDIVCDRAVEALVIVAFGLRFPEARLELLVLCAAIILSLTVFLTAAAALPTSVGKSFHYQAGLAERSEGFLFFSLMAVWPSGVPEVALVFALVVLFTAGQRLRSALGFFRD